MNAYECLCVCCVCVVCVCVCVCVCVRERERKRDKERERRTKRYMHTETDRRQRMLIERWLAVSCDLRTIVNTKQAILSLPHCMPISSHWTNLWTLEKLKSGWKCARFSLCSLKNSNHETKGRAMKLATRSWNYDGVRSCKEEWHDGNKKVKVTV